MIATLAETIRQGWEDEGGKERMSFACVYGS